MVKKAISVTLRPENLLWLRGQARAKSRRSVSDALDELIAQARTATGSRSSSVTSVVGSIHIAAADPGLTRANAVVRGLFSRPKQARRRRTRRTVPLPARRA